MPKIDKTAHEKYRKWHWGHAVKEVKDLDEPHLPEDIRLVETGVLTELHLDPVEGLDIPLVEMASMAAEAARMGHEPDELGVIAVDEKDYKNNHLSFDIDHPSQRLYINLSPSSRRDAAKHLWRKGEPSYSLFDLAKAVGGRHAQRDDYPDVDVQPIGKLYFVTYYTHKKGDDPPSKYIHRMGEEGGIEPVLAVSKDGHLFIAGGSYTCPNPGITH